MNKVYLIYGHRNKINGKWYVGQTKKKPDARFGLNGHNYCFHVGEHNKFARAIKKYGWDNFEHIILEEGIKEEDIDEREQFWIREKDSWKSGYNSNEGGRQNHTMSDTARARLSRDRKGSGNPMYGRKKPHSEETKIKISAGLTGRILSEESRKKIAESKKHLSAEARSNISNAKLGNNFRRRAVLQLDDSGNVIGEYSSMLLAARALSSGALNGSNISESIKEGRKAYGFFWKIKD